MSMRRRSILAALFATCCCLVAVGPAASLNYPNRVIKMIVPFPPGGPIDTMARLVAHELSTRLGQEVVVGNRPGAGSTLGPKAAASAEARLHAAVRIVRLARRRARALREARHRPTQAVRSGCVGLAAAARLRGGAVRAGDIRGGVRRLRQGQSRQA